MENAAPPLLKTRYTQDDLPSRGFHDCRITGIKWNDRHFSFTLVLDYIAEWVNPTETDKYYKFWICPAEMRFEDVDDVSIGLQWHRQIMECRIQHLQRRDQRHTPNGAIQTRWEIDLAAPSGGISVWATCLSLAILGPPVLSETQNLPIG
jgi:hypothetical protein